MSLNAIVIRMRITIPIPIPIFSTIFVGSAREVLRQKIKVFPQCLIVPGPLHFIEEEALSRFRKS